MSSLVFGREWRVGTNLALAVMAFFGAPLVVSPPLGQPSSSPFARKALAMI
jgi:hypothetical protein